MSDAPKHEEKTGPSDLEWLAQSLGMDSSGLQPTFVDLLNNLETMRLLGFESGDEIVSEGERGRDVYIMRDGAATVEIKGDDGATREVASLGPGDFFGEIGFLVENIRTATVRADGPVKVFRLNAPELRESLRAQQKVLRRIEEAARERIRELSDKLSS